jgi:alkylation response protein AidB-like acyl-CoA dehydrogenase
MMSDQNSEYVDSFARFIERRLPPEAHRTLLSKGGWDSALMDEVNALGWSIMARPEDADGLGLPLSSLRGLMELVGEKLVPGPLAEQLVLSALMPASTDSLLAFVDLGVTQDWSADIGTLTLEGDQLTGVVELVRFGKQAKHLLFAIAPANDAERSALVLLPSDDPAITIADLPSSDPTAHYAQVRINGRQVQPAEFVARGVDAHELVVRIRAWLRIYTACELAGIARRVLADTVAYTSQRQQFGRAVGSFQALKHLLASMAQGALSLEAYCEAVMSDADTQSLEDLELSAWSLKAYAASTARQVCENALQAHGGIGFTVEYDLHWYLRRSLALRTWYGDEHELSRLIGARRLAPLEQAA